MSGDPIPEKFVGKTTEEIQKHFDTQRYKEKKNRLKMGDSSRNQIDIDSEFSKILYVVHREVDKLVVLSTDVTPLDVKNHEAVIAYAKLISSLKKQMTEALRDMNPEDVEKIADED